jgi:alkylated DNA nucleotide flippase Atl1
LVKFVQFLERNRIRATYKAVAEAAGVPARSMGTLLGDRCALASWVVSDRTGDPTGYAANEKHAELYMAAEIIRTADDLVQRMRRERR